MEQIEFVCERLDALEDGGPARAALRLVAHASDAPRPPMTVLLAIDVSSSMTGEPLAYVRRAAVELVDLLGPQDRLGVVTFSATAREAAPVEPLTAEHAARVRGVVSALRAERGTNFEAALDEAARRMPPADEGRRTVVFLTDGYPSEGERRASVLAARVEREGWGLSALGFGAHFHEELVRELSDAGSGQVRFIEEPGLSRRAFALALGHHAFVALESARVSITPTGAARVAQAWGATPPRPRGVGVEYELASLVRGEAFTFALDVTLGEGGDGGLDVSLDALDAQGRPVRASIGWEAPADAGLARLAYWSARLDAARRAVEQLGAPEAIRQLEWLRSDSLVDLGAEPSAAADALLEQVEDDIEALRRAKPKTIARRLQADAERGERTLFTSITSRSARDSIVVFADSAAEPLGPGRARLEVAGDGPFPLPDDARHVLVGRSSDADVVISDPSVSRRHARIGREAGTFYVTDLGSTLGTFVDGDRVTTAALTGVVRLQFGHVHAVFRVAPGRVETPGISQLRAIERDPSDTRAPLAAQARVVPAQPPSLELPDGTHVPLVLPLVLIGSDPLCDVSLEGEQVAARHAVIALEGGARVLRAASDRPVEVGGAPVTRHVLHDGDVITCAGSAPLVFRAG